MRHCFRFILTTSLCLLRFLSFIVDLAVVVDIFFNLYHCMQIQATMHVYSTSYR